MSNESAQAEGKPAWHRCPDSVGSIEGALDDIQVHFPGSWENGASQDLAGWWAVSTADHGIVGYFADEADACSFRLAMINRWLNG